MATEQRASYGEKLGAWVARAWRSYLRGENAVLHYLRSRGSTEQDAALGVWLLRLVLAALLIALLPILSALLFYVVAAAIVVVIVIAAVVAFSSGKVEVPSSKPAEWRTDFQGTGLYEHDVRIDPHDPNDPRDME